MAKVTVANVGSLIDATTAQTTINNNNAAIVAAIDNTLSRDGSTPNQMQASLDMNSNHIINLPEPIDVTEPMRVMDAALLNGGGTITVSGIPVAGTQGQVLTKKSAINYDTDWETPSLTLSAGQVTSTTIATNTILNSNLIQAAPSSLKGNATASTTNVDDFTINGLTALTSPDAANDYYLIWDHVSNTFKKTNTNNISGALVAGVISIDAKLGTFTTGNGLETSGNVIQMSAARRTNPTVTILTTGTGTYTTPANCQFLKVRMVGGGGGGAGNGQPSGVSAPNGASTVFNGIIASPGGGGATNNNLTQGSGGAGGNAGSGSATIRRTGGSGGNGLPLGSGAGSASIGGSGGSSAFNAGPQGQLNFTATPGSGFGTGGAGVGTLGFGNVGPSGGGGAGEYVEIWISGPSSAYTYTVGAGGGPGGSGSAGANGASGAGGVIYVEEYYNS